MSDQTSPELGATRRRCLRGWGGATNPPTPPLAQTRGTMVTLAPSRDSVTRDSFRATHPRLAFLGRRTLRLILSLAVLVTLAFLMIHLIPGDPVRTALGPKAPPELIRQRRHDLWLHRPHLTQYAHSLHGLFTGDLGTSITSNLPVSDIISARLPSTAELAGISFVVIMLCAVPIGMFAAVVTRGGRRRGADLGFTSVTGLLATVPEF